MLEGALPENVVHRVISICLGNLLNAQGSYDLAEYGACLRKLNLINRAFRWGIETHPHASAHVLLHIGSLLTDPEMTIRRRQSVLRGITAKGCTRYFPRFLEFIATLEKITDVHLVHMPLLDFEFESVVRWANWPSTLRRLSLIGTSRGPFILPSSLPLYLERLDIEGGQGTWDENFRFPPLLRRLEFRKSAIMASKNFVRTFPILLEWLSLGLECRGWSLVELAKRSPNLRWMAVRYADEVEDVEEGVKMLPKLEETYDIFV